MVGSEGGVRALITWLLLTVGVVGGAEPYAPSMTEPTTEPWRRTYFRELDGRKLYDIAQGPGDAIWIGLESGAVRYDGETWEEFTAEQGLTGAVRSFAADDQRLFAATNEAIFVFEQERWRQVFPWVSERTWIIDELCLASDGSLWAATNWGVLRLHDPTDQEIHVSLFASDKNCKGFAREGHSLETFAIDALSQRSWKPGCGLRIHASEPGRCVVTELAPGGPADNAGVQLGDTLVRIGGAVRLEHFQDALDAPVGEKRKLWVSRPGLDEPLEFVLTAREINAETKTFRPCSLVQGGDGQLWCGSERGEIYSWGLAEPNAWIEHTVKHGFQIGGPPAFSSTPGGVAVVRTQGVANSLHRFEAGQWSESVISASIHHSITATRKGAVWVGRRASLGRVSQKRRKTMPLHADGFVGHNVNVICSRDGAIWAGSANGFLMRFEPHGVRWLGRNRLIFLAASDDANWFATPHYTLVRQRDDQWDEFSSSDGLMDVATNVLVTRDGHVWASGSHEGEAATAQLIDGRWHLTKHPELSWCVGRRAAFEDREGRIWFGAAGPIPAEKGFLGGAVRYDGEQWTRVVEESIPVAVELLTQAGDGSMWIGGPALLKVTPDGQVERLESLERQFTGPCTALISDRDGDVWLGTTSHGVAQISADMSSIRWHDESYGLKNMGIRNLIELPNGGIVVNHYTGFACFDGRSWSRYAIPAFRASAVDLGGLRRGRDNEIWFSRSRHALLAYDQLMEERLDRTARGVWASRYAVDSTPPNTKLVGGPSTAPEKEPVTFSWVGVDPWNRTANSDLTYSWRVDDQPFGPFHEETYANLTGLTPGEHRFEVRARDADFNIESSPATIIFQVVPPIWRQAWFQGVAAVGLVVAVFACLQTIRVFRREASLRRTNQQLRTAEESLKSINASLEGRVARRTEALQDANTRLKEEIRERESAESRLFESEQRYRSIVEDQSEYIVRFGADGSVEFANESFVQNSLGRAIDTAAPLEPQFDEATRERLKQCISSVDETNPASAFVQRVEQPGGPARWEDWQVRLIRDANGATKGFQAVGRDITELRSAEQKLHEKEQILAHLGRVSAIGEMVAEVSHEINQPLAAIANFSAASMTVLDAGQGDTRREQLKEWSQLISDQTFKISKIIEGLRRFGRPETKRESVQLSRIVDEALSMTECRTQVDVDHLEVDCSAQLPNVLADPVQIEQVLVNLIRNACDAMKDREGERRLQIRVSALERHVSVSVTDSGPGVAPEIADELFDAFKTTKTDGMGIGLAICRSIVQAHGGSIDCVNKSGGAQFLFTLPTTFDAAQTDSDSRPAAGESRRSA